MNLPIDLCLIGNWRNNPVNTGVGVASAVKPPNVYLCSFRAYGEIVACELSIRGPLKDERTRDVRVSRAIAHHSGKHHGPLVWAADELLQAVVRDVDEVVGPVVAVRQFGL